MSEEELRDSGLANAGENKFGKEYWDGWHEKKAREFGRVIQPFPLAEWVAQRALPKDYPVIADLGCGRGNDTLFLADRGFEVHAVDISSLALDVVCEEARRRKLAGVRVYCRDISRPLPFESSSISLVYSHLALHYFDDSTTQDILKEIWRVLRPEGLLVFAVKSTRDPLCGLGFERGPNIFERKGHVRHFFSVPYTQRLLKRWDIEVLSEVAVEIPGKQKRSFVIRAAARKVAEE